MATVNQLKTLIKISGVPVVAIADKSGVSLRSIRYWISGEKEPGEDNLDRVWQAGLDLARQRRNNAVNMTRKLAVHGIYLDGV